MMIRLSRDAGLAVVAFQCLTSLGAPVPAPVFNNTWQAQDVFEKSLDATVRRAAYDWMKDRALSSAPRDFSDPFSRLARMAEKLACEDEFEALCRDRMTNGNAEVVCAAVTQLADLRMRHGEPEKAVADLRGTLARPKGFLNTSQTASVASKVAGILSGSLDRPAEAVEVLDRAIDAVSTNDAASFASLANAQIALFLTRVANPQGAERRCRQVLELGDACPGPAYASAADALVSVLRANGDAPGVAEVFRGLSRHSSFPNSGVARKLLDAGIGGADVDEVIRILRLKMAAPCSGASDFRSRAERVQPELVELLLARGHFAEAAGESRVFMYSAWDKAYPRAVELAARSLKMLDGNLGRANALLAFQGADATNRTVRSDHNVLMEIPPLRDAIRQDARKALAASAVPVDWNGWLLRSAYLLWLDSPVEAMESAAQAFSTCPLSDSALQSCAEAMVRPLLVMTRDTATAQAALDYLLYGPLGRDGRPSTADDLTDPFPAIRQRLAVSVVQKTGASN